jgi:hypothetical protein
MGTEPTWIVITRDVSHAVRVEGESHLVAAMVLDSATGLVHGASIAASRREVLSQTLRMALTQPPGPIRPQRPQRVLCGQGQAAEISGELGRQLASAAAPEVSEVEPIGAAEDIFDSFIGHMSGRRQPEELPMPEDWQQLTTAAHEYHQAAPWERWSDTDHLDLVVRIDGQAARYVAIVLGQEGIQRGLVLYPGAVVPEALRDWEPGDPVPLPAGTLMFYLDPPADIPAELIARAHRYGWPAEADLVPLWFAGDPDGGGDVSRGQANQLTLATVAVLARDRAADRTTGRLTLAGGENGEFTIG